MTYARTRAGQGGVFLLALSLLFERNAHRNSPTIGELTLIKEATSVESSSVDTAVGQ